MTIDDDSVLIIGGGAAAHAFVDAHRDAGGTAPIAIVSADDRLPYFRPTLTKELLTGATAESSLSLDSYAWYAARDTTVHLECEASTIDIGERVVSTTLGPMRFGQLVIATGSDALTLPMPGAEDERVRTIRSAADARAVLTAARSGGPVAVIGSGFVGCEAAASLRARGLDVTMVSTEQQPQHGRLSSDVGALVDGWLRSEGITMRMSTSVVGLSPRDDSIVVHLDDGSTIDAAHVLAATGARPRTRLAETAGLRMEHGGVAVDASMRTAAPGIFAAGDIAFAFNSSAGRQLRVEHWGDAERMGRTAGRVTAGQHDEWSDVPGFWSQIASHQLKFVAWSDGWDRTRVRRSAEGMTVWYGRDGELVGVLTFEHDDDLEIGTALIRSHAPFE